ncbi:unnamed protein product [Caenorhabditis brenneri]
MATEPIEPVSIAMPENIMGEILEKCDSLSMQTQKKTGQIPPELISMPEDVMILILEKCDFVSIQRLRSTCRIFQEFIDRKKPKSHLKVIDINGSLQAMYLSFSEEDAWQPLYPDGQNIELKYQKIDEKNTEIHWFRRDKECIKTIENSNFMDVCCRDLEPLLERNSTNFDLLGINSTHEGYVNIQKVLESCVKSPLKVHALTIGYPTCQEDVVEILRYICPDTFERLEIQCHSDCWDISKIVELDHWKNAKNFHIRGMSFRAFRLQNFMHFERADFTLEEGTAEDVIRVKENFLNSPPTSKLLRIYFDRFNDKDRLVELFGQPYQLDYRSFEWFFRRPDNYALFLKYRGSSLECKILKLADIPEDARVIS